MIDLTPYKIPLIPIPGRMEKAIGNGVIAGEFPDWSEAPRVLQDWGACSDRVIRSLDGRVLVTCMTEMPGVAPSMIDWWFGWHLTDTERYKLWHPLAHTWTKAKENREYLADDRSKYVGNGSYVNEYIGKSHKRFAIDFHAPEEFGFSQIYATGATAICAHTSDRLLGSEGGCLVHLVIPTETGSEMRSGFWLGKFFPHWPVVGSLLEPVVNIPAIRRMAVSDQMALDLLRHCAEEMNHLVRFLPSLYLQLHKH